MAKSVDEYVESHPKWTQSLELLRELLLDTELEETIKWGAPYYTFENKNVVGFVAFKKHVALWFPNGVFLDDPDNRLTNAGEGGTKAGRQLRFYSHNEIDSDLIKDFINQAIANQKAGIEHKPKRNKELEVPPELEKAFKEHTGLNKHFHSLTAYKQREFSEYISEAKRTSTKEKRLNKIIPMIFDGIGLHDKYR